MKPSSPVLVAGLLLALLAFHACGDLDPVEPGSDPAPDPTLPDFSGSCDAEGGTVRRGTVSGIWTRNQSPHRVAETVYVSGELVIEAGALVCLGPDAAISWRPEKAGTVVARGTAEAPVVFTADRPGGRWGGFVFRSLHATGTAAVDLTHVVIENATTGIDLGYGQSARVSEGLIRRITGPGVYAGGIHLRNVVVDSVCQGGWQGGSCTAVSAFNYASVVLKDVWIKDSGGSGVGMGDRGTLSLAKVRITGSASTGLYLSWPPGRSGSIGEVVHPIHITGGHGHPASLPASVVPHLLPDLEAQERWTGNADDVISVYHSGSLGDLVVGPRLAWALSSEEFGPSVSHLTMLPGARFSGGNVGRFTAEGTPEQPVSIHGTILYGSEAGPSRIVHGRLRSMIIRSGEAHALEMSDVLVENGYVSLDAPGSRLERVFVRGVLDRWPSYTHVPPFPRGAAPTEAVRIGAADVLISSSEISHSPSDGIRVEVATDVRVQNSNIRYNAGVGLRNVAAEAVDARDNWWGDPAGPDGPLGDGVLGAVEYEPFRTSPVVVLGGPVAAAITLTPSTAQIPAGDKAHLSAVVLNPSGAPLLSERIVWRSSDTAVAAVAPTGLVTGVRPGDATITAEAASEPNVRATAAIHVTPGAPPYEWTRYDLGPNGAIGGIWGTADAGIFVAGYGVVHHFDGAVWRETKFDPQVQMMRVSGSAPNDVWLIGHDHSRDPPPAVVLRYDGSSWERVPPPGDVSLWGLWVAAPDRIYVEGYYRVHHPTTLNALWRFNGTAWEEELTVHVSTLWARSRDDIFAGTSEGTLHFDGHTWTSIGGPASPVALHGTATDLFALHGYGGAFSRYDGAAWTVLPAPPAGDHYIAMAGEAGSIFACGGRGAVGHYDGDRWWRMWLGTSEPSFTKMAVVGEDVYLVAWGEVYRGQPR
jgi:hypothetical protein